MVPMEERRHGDVTDIHRYAFQGVSPVNGRELRSETFCENSKWGGELSIFSWCRHAQPTQTVADGNDNRGAGVAAGSRDWPAHAQVYNTKRLNPEGEGGRGYIPGVSLPLFTLSLIHI